MLFILYCAELVVGGASSLITKRAAWSRCYHATHGKIYVFHLIRSASETESFRVVYRLEACQYVIDISYCIVIGA